MLILSLHSGPNDSSAALFDDYELIAAVSEERLNRIKCSGGFPHKAVAEVLRIAGRDLRHVDTVACSRASVLDLDLRPDCRIFFSDHHVSHALPSLFFTDWDDALLYTADGGGDQVYYSHHLFKNGRLGNLYGDDRWRGKSPPSGSIGLAYSFVTEALGWRSNRHEGKLTGLAAHGKPTLLDAMRKHFQIDPHGRIEMDFPDHAAMRSRFHELALRDSKENAAASVQALLEEIIHESVRRLLATHGVRHLGLAGGVFANVRLNRKLAEELPIDEIFIVPPMGDDGLVIGGALQFLLERDGLAPWLKQRRRLANVYWAGNHDAAVPGVFNGSGKLRRHEGDPAALAAGWLAKGRIGAIYAGRMEYGPRALGARTILASPADGAVNQSLNDRLDRSDFMPFAPVVTDADAAEVFDLRPVNRYAARFMTVTCGVRDKWKARIPAVVHVDGSARPQVIRRDDNALYYDVLQGFKRHSGLPVLVNTSFNVHEEPIINRPEECLTALLDGRVDFVVTPSGVWDRSID